MTAAQLLVYFQEKGNLIQVNSKKELDKIVKYFMSFNIPINHSIACINKFPVIINANTTSSYNQERSIRDGVLVVRTRSMGSSDTWMYFDNDGLKKHYTQPDYNFIENVIGISPDPNFNPDEDPEVTEYKQKLLNQQS